MSTDSWHCGKLARVARSSDAVELQSTNRAKGELTYVRLSLRETFGGSAPLKDSQNLEAHVPATSVLASRCMYDALARSETSKFGLKRQALWSGSVGTQRSLVESRCGLGWAHPAARCMNKGAEEAP